MQLHSDKQHKCERVPVKLVKLVKLDCLPGPPFFNLWVKLGSCASTVVIDPSGTSKYASVLLSCQQFQTVPTLGLRKTTSQKWRVHLSQRHGRSLFRCLFRRRVRNARWSPPMAFSFGWTMRLVPTTQAAACAPVVRASEFPAHPSLASTRISQIQVARYGKIQSIDEYRQYRQYRQCRPTFQRLKAAKFELFKACKEKIEQATQLTLRIEHR